MHTVGYLNKGAGQKYSGPKRSHCDSLYTELDDLLAAPTVFNIHNVVIQGFDPGGEIIGRKGLAIVLCEREHLAKTRQGDEGFESADMMDIVEKVRLCISSGRESQFNRECNDTEHVGSYRLIF